jgi:hypothetical protein
VLLLWLSAPVVLAQDGPSSLEEAARVIEGPRNAASRFLESLIQRTDSLFGGDQVYDAPTGSYLQLGGGVTLQRSQDGGTDSFPLTRAKVNLPHTSERVQLLVDRNIESVTRSLSDRAAATAAGQGGADAGTFVGLRGVAVEQAWVRITADAGVRPRGLTPDPYARLRAEKVFHIGAWKVPLSETLLWRRSDEASAASQVGLYRALRDDLALALFSNATWRSRTQAFDLSEVATLTRRLGAQAIVSAEFGVYGSTETSTQVNAWSMALRYRRKLGSDWLLGEVRPQLIYPRSNGFQPVPSLTVSLEVFLGQGRLPGL